ncbi:MAG: hypothetical protein JRM80_06920 [Nitrososphaerota archaeon]|nr:hypothetical protein [Nitrososphaerota archaeon]
MNRETLKRLEENYNAFIAPLLDDRDTEDVSLNWEFQKFAHTKRLRVLTAERDGIKKWKQVLLSR